MTAALVEILFEPDHKRVWVRAGATLLEAAEAAGVEILTGCTRGQCGTDAVRVVGEGLVQPAEPERGTLERMGLGTEFRLSCSARVANGPIVVELDRF